MLIFECERTILGYSDPLVHFYLKTTKEREGYYNLALVEYKSLAKNGGGVEVLLFKELFGKEKVRPF